MRPFILLALSLASTLAGDEIVLADGRRIEGEVLSRPAAEQVVIRIREDRMTAELRFPVAQVVTITLGQTPRQLALAKLDADRGALKHAAKPDGSAWWALAVRAKALEQRALARDCAKEAIALDPDHAQARAALGYEQVDGKWLKGTEAALARGEVLLRGTWMSPERRDAILADEAQAATDAEARQKAQLAALEVARQKALLAAARREAQAEPASNLYVGVRSYGPSLGSVYGPVWPGALPVGAAYTTASYSYGCGPVFDLNLSGRGWSFRLRN